MYCPCLADKMSCFMHVFLKETMIIFLMYMYIHMYVVCLCLSYVYLVYLKGLMGLCVIMQWVNVFMAGVQVSPVWLDICSYN